MRAGRKPFSLSALFASTPMVKGFAWSLAIHLLFAAMLFVATGENRTDFMPITVLLAGDLPGEAGGDGRTATSQYRRAKSTKAKGSQGGYRDSATLSGTVVKREKPAVSSDAGHEASAPEEDLSTGIHGSESRQTGTDAGPTAGAGQDPSGGGGHEGGNGDGKGGVGLDHGTGSGMGRGAGGGGAGSYLSANFSYIRDRILKGLRYPEQARRMGWKGRVTISFVISDNGCVDNIKVLESSGHGVLDAHAVKTIRNCQPFPRPPVKAEVVIPIVFRIG